MIEGRSLIRGKKTVYIKELDQTYTEDDFNTMKYSELKQLLGFMNEKELQRLINLNIDPRCEMIALPILINCNT